MLFCTTSYYQSNVPLFSTGFRDSSAFVLSGLQFACRLWQLPLLPPHTFSRTGRGPPTTTVSLPTLLSSSTARISSKIPSRPQGQTSSPPYQDRSWSLQHAAQRCLRHCRSPDPRALESSEDSLLSHQYSSFRHPRRGREGHSRSRRDLDCDPPHPHHRERSRRFPGNYRSAQGQWSRGCGGRMV